MMKELLSLFPAIICCIELLAQAGFCGMHSYFQALRFRAFHTTKAE